MANKATFAGGCFWCMEPPFRKEQGVIDVISGYTGGNLKKPSYEQVSSGKTGHVEAVQVTYDPKKVSYERLLQIFWRQIDPADGKGQFADKGSQYRTAVFYHDQEQKKAAEKSKRELEKRLGRIATQVRQAGEFYPAEEYHQDYAKKNPVRYQAYKLLSGREQYLKKAWRKN
jgi:peptide methionine sulfoxide reductase msrA/msrB